MTNKAKQRLAAVLTILERKDIPLHKAVIHKFLYFLNTQGVWTGFRFEPYTYGPFSFDLAKTLGSMHFWDEIKEGKREIELVNLERYETEDAELNKTIEKHLDNFTSIVDPCDFAQIERFGTILYCAETLANQGQNPTLKRVEKEFLEWKKSGHTEDQIRKMYEKMKAFLPKPETVQ